jgi:hypothetical protein
LYDVIKVACRRLEKVAHPPCGPPSSLLEPWKVEEREGRQWGRKGGATEGGERGGEREREGVEKRGIERKGERERERVCGWEDLKLGGREGKEHEGKDRVRRPLRGVH